MVISLVLIVVLGFFVYFNSLKGEFVWDDEYLVRDNPRITSFSNFTKIFRENIGTPVGKNVPFYRPLQVLTYMFDYKLWQLNVIGYHLTNILAHILVAISIYFLIYALFASNLASIIVALLFVAHPIHTQVVSYISGRADSLASLFMFLCFISYLKFLDKKKIFIFICMSLAYLFALLSKEFSLALLSILLIYHIIFRKKIEFISFIVLLSLGLAYIFVRKSVMGSLISGSIASSTTLLERVPGFFAAIAGYLKLLILPFDLHMEYGYKSFPWADFRVIAGIIVILASLVYAWIKRKEDKLISFAVAWFFITLLPHSNLYPLNAYMAEHWMYLPSLGFFMILANFLSGLLQQRKLRSFGLTVLIGLLGFYSILTIKQNITWQEPVSFYKRILSYAPHSPRVHYNLANVYGNSERFPEAIASYKRALELDPNDEQSYNNLGNVYRAMNDIQKAIASYKKAVEINPEYAQAYYNIGNAYRVIKDNQEAVTYYVKALKLQPQDAHAYNNLGNAYQELGMLDDAQAAYEKAIEIKPDYCEVHNNLGAVYYRKKDYPQAVELFKKALTIKPDYADVYNNLGNIYKVQGNFEAAITYYEKALELGLKDREIYVNLGNLFRHLKDNGKAIDYYIKAVELDPNDGASQNNLAVAYYNQGNFDLAIKHCDIAVALGHEVHPDFLELLRPHRSKEDD